MPLVGAAPARLTLKDGDLRIDIRGVPPASEDPTRWQLPAVVCREWDPGAPEPRTSTSERAGLDGIFDGTAFTSSRTVTLDLVVFGGGTSTGGGYTGIERTAYTVVEQLTAMTHPGRRPVLIIARDVPETAGEEWEMRLRGNPFSITYGRKAAAMLELQLAFTAPEGYFESPLRESRSPTVSALYLQHFFPVALPMTFGIRAYTTAAFAMDVRTSAPVAPILYVYGPATDPRVRLTDGRMFAFDGLNLNAGENVQVDMGAGTVLLNGQSTAPVYHLVNWAVSTFWRLSAPTAAVFTGGQVGGKALIQWRERRFTI